MHAYPQLPSTFSPLREGEQNSGRSRQVQQLLSCISPCQAVNRDQSVFETPVWLPNGQVVALRITLPSGFPQVAPQLALAQPVMHPLVDPAGRLSMASLSAWGSRSQLVDVVTEAKAQLSGADDGWQLVSAASSGGLSGQLQQQHLHRPSPQQQLFGSRQNSPGPQQQHQQPPTLQQEAQQRRHSPLPTGRPPPPKGPTRAPSVPGSFPQLEELTIEQLAAALAIETEYRQLLTGVLQASETTQLKAQLRQGNRDLAHVNLEREGTLGEIRNQIAIVRSSEYAAAKERFDLGAERQAAVLARLKPEVLIAGLGKAAVQADQQSEELYEAFMSSDKPVEAFVAEYSRSRSLYHMRDLKRSAAQQLLA